MLKTIRDLIPVFIKKTQALFFTVNLRYYFLQYVKANNKVCGKFLYLLSLNATALIYGGTNELNLFCTKQQ